MYKGVERVQRDVFIKRLGSRLSAEVTENGDTVTLQFNGMPYLRGDDVLSYQDAGQAIELRIKQIQQVTSPNGYGMAAKIITVPIKYKERELALKADIALDGDTYILKLKDSLEFQDGKKKVRLQMVGTGVELKAKGADE